MKSDSPESSDSPAKKEYETLSNGLKNLQFLFHSDSQCYKNASCFFDLDQEVFKVMESPSEFPPKPYNSSQWIPFLKACGLTSIVTEKKFIEYAQVIERMSVVSNKDEVCKRSKALVEHLLNKDESKLIEPPAEFINKIKSINFVKTVNIPEKLISLCELCFASRSLKSQFVSFCDSYEKENMELVWTVSSVLELPSIAKQKQNFLSCLGVRLEVECTTVCEHLKNICFAYDSLPMDERLGKKNVFLEVLQKIYYFLSNENCRFTPENWDLLKEIPCIVIDRNLEVHLARADMVVVKLEREIMPYLYQFPIQLGNYLEFFKKLGVKETPEFEHYARLLCTIGKGCLNSNQKESVALAFSGLLERLCRVNIILMK